MDTGIQPARALRRVPPPPHGGQTVLDLVDAAAAWAGLDPKLVHAIVRAESSYRADGFRHEPGYYRRHVEGNDDLVDLPWYGEPRRISSSYGLCQLMYPTALAVGYPRWLPPELLFTPHINVRLGATLMRQLVDKYADTRDVLAAYNSGRPFDRAPRTTREHYVPTVLGYMEG